MAPSVRRKSGFEMFAFLAFFATQGGLEKSNRFQPRKPPEGAKFMAGFLLTDVTRQQDFSGSGPAPRVTSVIKISSAFLQFDISRIFRVLSRLK
jgi:hypothetical protein